MRHWFATVRFAATLLCASFPALLLAQGTTIAVGGALQDGNAEVWQALVQRVASSSGGGGDSRACYSILTIASGEPDESAARVVANLARHGGRGVHLRVGPRIAGQDAAAEVNKPERVAELKRCRGVYMTGGAQARLMDTLRPANRDSLLMQAMRELWREGGVVAGSSAGTAVLSEVAFRDAPDPLAVMKGRLREGVEWQRGFAFTPPGVVLDQHAVRRGRIARLLPLMLATQQTLGVAVEENSAAVFAGSELLAIGGRGLLIADTAAATTRAAPLAGVFGVAGATLHWLESGDRLDLASRRVLPAPRKLAGTALQPLSAQHRGYLPGAWHYSDILADNMIVTALARLVDGDQRELVGLAFAARPAKDDPEPDLGFEWRLWLDDSTRGWLLTNPEAYTVAGARLDIVPVRINRPLTSPWSPAR